MADGNQFVPTGEENLMLADDRTAAHSMDANLVFIPLGAFGMAVEFIVRLLLELPGNRVRQHQRGAAGRINLLIMMLFDDLNIKGISQYPGRFLSKLSQQADSDRHIGGEENRHFFGRFMDGSNLLLI